MARVTESVAAISRLERPCARQASTSRSRELSSSFVLLAERAGPHRAGERAVQTRPRRAARPSSAGADHGREVVGAARRKRDAARAERDEIADDVLLAGCEQRDHRRRRAQPREPANGVGDREVGGLADHDEVGPFDRRDARELAPGVRLGDHLDTLRVQHRRDAEPGERQLVGDDRRVGHRCCRALPLLPPRVPRPGMRTDALPTARHRHASRSESFNPAVDQAGEPRRGTKRSASGDKPSGTGGCTK